MRLISAGSLVRAQPGPVFARAASREGRLSRRNLGDGGPLSQGTSKRGELRLGRPAFSLSNFDFRLRSIGIERYLSRGSTAPKPLEGGPNRAGIGCGGIESPADQPEDRNREHDMQPGSANRRAEPMFLS